MASSSRVPAPYSPRPTPPLPASLPVFLTRELRDIQETLAGVLALLPQDAVMAPDNPVSGMIRRAVAPWRPVIGQTADRWVSYQAGAWAYLV